MPKKVKCKNCKFLVRGWCREKIDSPDPDLERDCRDFRERTNADRIRAMTDEELGRFLAEVENRRSAAGGGAIWKGAAHAIEWLRQPVKED